jgi:hypothetical protein
MRRPGLRSLLCGKGKNIFTLILYKNSKLTLQKYENTVYH